MVDPSIIFIDGTHIKASANKKKFQKEQVAKAAKVYSGQLRREAKNYNEHFGFVPLFTTNIAYFQKSFVLFTLVFLIPVSLANEEIPEALGYANRIF